MDHITDIYFVRHAESFGNLTRRAYGWYDGMVTPRGYEQIECLRKRFANVDVDVVYSSDIIRACETAKAIYENKGIPFHTDAAFREVSLGAWEDMPWGEIPELFPEAYFNWCENPLEFDVPGGETYNEVYKRAKTALDGLVARNDGKTIAVVSHGATLRMLMHGLLNGDSLEGVEKSHWGDNTCVSLLKYENGTYTEAFRNDNSHLSNMPGFEENMRWVKEGVGRNAAFRLAELPEDKEKIRRYYSLAWKEIFGEELENYRDVDKKARRILAKSKYSIAFAYCPSGEIGVIILDEEMSVCPEAGHISVVYLNPEFRRMRYGIQIIGHAMSRYKSLGKKHISVRVAEDNVAAQNFYKKYGFYEAYREIEDSTKQIVMLLDI
ncbi:MAG: GNAT family N-acetyltransferase [Oscillospiraceae bacterium]|nr:GNAT family N-acetyltransferase [Oscillospiraceae bacterium]